MWRQYRIVDYDVADTYFDVLMGTLQEAGKLLDSVETTRAEIAPRKRFSFRSRKSGKGSAGTGRSGVSKTKAAAESTPPAVTGGI